MPESVLTPKTHSQPGAVHSPRGCHLLLEFSGCDAAALLDADAIGTAMEKVVDDSGATRVETVFHTFAPQGVSGVVVIAESHVTIHTWPEYGYAAFDIFTCGQREVALRIRQGLIDWLRPDHIEEREFERRPSGSVPVVRSE